MSNARRPVARIVFKTRDGKKYDVGTIWPADRKMDGHFGNLSPQKETVDGQYPKMAMAEALRMQAEGGGFLDVWHVGDRQQSEPRRERQGGGGFQRVDDQGGPAGGDFPADDFGDDDIPFTTCEPRAFVGLRNKSGRALRW